MVFLDDTCENYANVKKCTRENMRVRLCALRPVQRSNSATMAAMAEEEYMYVVRHCCVRGYHVYQSVWLSVVGEQLACVREPTNTSDVHAEAVVKSGNTIGHLPRKISTLCSIFLREVEAFTV